MPGYYHDKASVTARPQEFFTWSTDELVVQPLWTGTKSRKVYIVILCDAQNVLYCTLSSLNVDFEKLLRIWSLSFCVFLALWWDFVLTLLVSAIWNGPELDATNALPDFKRLKKFVLKVLSPKVNLELSRSWFLACDINISSHNLQNQAHHNFRLWYSNAGCIEQGLWCAKRTVQNTPNWTVPLGIVAPWSLQDCVLTRITRCTSWLQTRQIPLFAINPDSA